MNNELVMDEIDLEFFEDRTLQCDTDDELIKRKNEWEEIDDLVFLYQKQYKEDATEEDKVAAESAATILLEKFYPLFKKYLTVIKTGQINFDNAEQKLFVLLFMDAPELKRALYSKEKIDRNTKSIIFQKFNFIKETYGHNDDEEILTDLYMHFFVLAKRYKKMQRSFCCYVYNAFRYEVFRHIQKFTRNPANIHYRNIPYEECSSQNSHELANNNEIDLEDKIYTNELGLPDLSWIQGLNCSGAFAVLTPLERKLISKYYLEFYTDRQIAKEYGLHINTCNMKRHQAVAKLAEALGVDKSTIKRSRNSGLKRLI